MASKTAKRGAPPVTRTRILMALTEGPATAKALDTTQTQIANMLKAGFIQRQTSKGKVVTVQSETPSRGRPAHYYVLSLRGRNLVRAAMKAAQSEPVAA